MPDELTPSLDGDPSANYVFGQVFEMMTDTLNDLRLSSGNENTVAGGGFPFGVIERKERAPETREEQEVRNESPIRFAGGTLIVEDPLNGDDGTFQYTVLGEEFTDGVARVADVRNPDGGFLVFEFTVTITASANTTGAFSPTVQMVHQDSWVPSTYPTAIAGNYSNDAAVTEGVNPGTLRQLCASYDRTGRVTIWRRRPDLEFSGLATSTHYNFTG